MRSSGRGRLLVGADESHLVDYINAIAAAVKALVQNVHAAIAEGRDVDDILRNIVSMRRTRTIESVLDDPGLLWAMREADLLLRVWTQDQRKRRLDQLDALPEPPAFYW